MPILQEAKSCPLTYEFRYSGYAAHHRFIQALGTLYDLSSTVPQDIAWVNRAGMSDNLDNRPLIEVVINSEMPSLGVVVVATDGNKEVSSPHYAPPSC